MARLDIRNHPRLLIVEGEDDKRVVPWLVEGSGLVWHTDDHGVIVGIRSAGSHDDAKQLVPLELKAAARRSVGLLVDADRSAHERWTSIRQHCLATIDDVSPDQWPLDPIDDGLVIDFDPPQGRRRLGVWIMPDNRSPGMLETFLQGLGPHGSPAALLDLAERTCDEAKRGGAPFVAAHRDKAVIHTWLAWQNPPGRQLHDAIKQRQLDPRAERGQAFVRWFRRLFEV